MKIKPSFVLCTVATCAAAVLSSCKPSQPAATESAKPAASASPAAPAASASASPAAAAVELKDPVATVNGEPITKAQLEEAFNNALASAGVKAADLTPAQQLMGYNQLLEELVMEKLVSAAAANVTVSDADVDAELAKIKGQFPNEEKFNEQLAASGQTLAQLKDSIKKMLQQQKWIDSQIAGKINVTPAEAQKFYDDNPTEFQQSASVKASHILITVDKDAPDDVVKQKLEEAKKAAARAQKEDFAKVAKELSQEPGASESGGDLGFFTKEQMVPEFAEAAFSQKINVVGQPVRTQFGWHVIKVTETKPARTVPFAEVKDKIIAYLKADQQRKAVQTLLKGLYDSAKVESTLPAPPAPTMPGVGADAAPAAPGAPAPAAPASH